MERPKLGELGFREYATLAASGDRPIFHIHGNEYSLTVWKSMFIIVNGSGESYACQRSDVESAEPEFEKLWRNRRTRFRNEHDFPLDNIFFYSQLASGKPDKRVSRIDSFFIPTI